MTGRGAVWWAAAATSAAWIATGTVVWMRGRSLLATIVVGLAALCGVALSASGHEHAAALGTVAAGLIPAAALALELAMPDGVLGPGRRGAVLAAAFAGMSAAIGVTIAGGELTASVTAAATIVAVAAGLPAVGSRFRFSLGLARRRLQLVACAGLLGVAASLVGGALVVLVGLELPLVAVALGSTVLLPMALALGTFDGVARHADRALAAAVALVALAGLTVTLQAVMIGVRARFPTPAERPLAALSMLVTAVAAVAYGPLRRRLGETADRLASGGREPPAEVLRRVGGRVRQQLPLEEVLLQLAESLRPVLATGGTEVWTGSGGELRRSISLPRRPSQVLTLAGREQAVLANAGVVANAWLETWLPSLIDDRDAAQLRVAPACHGGEVLGLIVVERPSDHDRFTENDELVLGELARQLGVVLHNRRLDAALHDTLADLQRANEELRASRGRLVSASDAERRRIERDLHDGAQQHLLNLALRLRLARDMVMDDDTTGAARALGELAVDAKEAIQELRDLAHGIYPALLGDRGLAAALRATGSRLALAVSVQADGVMRPAPDVEAAVYYCCLEALQNAAKHAPDSPVRVRLWQADEQLCFEVADDGPGLGARASRRGDGFTNMTDRMGAIGGQVHWESPESGGTVITGRAPLRRRE